MKKSFEYLGRAIMCKGRVLDFNISEQDFIREVLNGDSPRKDESSRNFLMRKLRGVKRHGFVKIPNDVIFNYLLNKIESLILEEVECVMEACGGGDYV